MVPDAGSKRVQYYGRQAPMTTKTADGSKAYHPFMEVNDRNN